MIFESHYRRKAMTLWEESKAETKQEIIADIQRCQGKIHAVTQKLKNGLSLLYKANRKSYPK